MKKVIVLFLVIIAIATSSIAYADGPINNIDFSNQPIPILNSYSSNAETFNNSFLALNYYTTDGLLKEVAYFVNSISNVYIFAYNGRLTRIATDDPAARIYQITKTTNLDGSISYAILFRPTSSYSAEYFLYYSAVYWGTVSMNFNCPIFNNLNDGLSYVSAMLGTTSSSYDSVTDVISEVLSVASGLLIIILRNPILLLLFCFPAIAIAFYLTKRIIYWR